MSEIKGQILPDSEFGELLTALAKQCENIVEIGTWHGKGSTLCLSRGLVRVTQCFWTIDPSKEMWLEAQGYYRDARMRFLNARTVDVLNKLPLNIHLILFDGHDEETDEEFDKLYTRLRKFVALDDTNVRKNQRQVKLLLERGWRVLKQRTGDRNGWAVFEAAAP